MNLALLALLVLLKLLALLVHFAIHVSLNFALNAQLVLQSVDRKKKLMTLGSAQTLLILYKRLTLMLGRTFKS